MSHPIVDGAHSRAGGCGTQRGAARWPGGHARSEIERWTPCQAGKGSLQRAQRTESSRSGTDPPCPLWRSLRGNGWVRAWAKSNEGPHVQREPLSGAGATPPVGHALVWLTLGDGPTSKFAIQGYCILRKSELVAGSRRLPARASTDVHCRWFFTSVGCRPIHDVKDQTGGKRFFTDANIIRTNVTYVKRQHCLSLADPDDFGHRGRTPTD
jgi:hypothetical protein